MHITIETDTQFEDCVIKTVTPEGDGWIITRESGWSFFVPNTGAEAPKPGNPVRFYGKGIGSTVRGLVIAGTVIFYRNEADYLRHFEEQMFGRDCVELLERWDKGRGIWSIELGGIGPGYEQAIQLTGFEMLRVLVRHQFDMESDPDGKKMRKLFDAEVTPKINKLGLSGAQWGAATNLACVFWKNGPVGAMNMVGRDRHIQVSRIMPSLEAGQ